MPPFETSAAGNRHQRDVRRKPEVKSPAGHWPQMHAAIEAGADAVYFGLKHFTARAKVGFTLEELPEVDAHSARARRTRLRHLQYADLRT